MRFQNCTRYKQQDISLFINHLCNLRWKNNDNKSFPKCCTKTRTICNTPSPLSTSKGVRYKAIKVCEVMIGNSFASADYAWKNRQAESPMCRCGRSEETAERFFLACGLFQDIRPENIDSLNLLDPEDCNTIVDYISRSTK